MNSGKNSKVWAWLGQGLALVTLSVALAGCDSSAGSASSASPTVSGTPAATVAANNRYSFQPTMANSVGKPISFSIRNKPVWASFGLTSGELSGTPDTPDTGKYDNIVIAATDGKSTSSLPPFSIQVVAASSSSSSSSSGGSSTSNSSSSSGAGDSSSSSGSSSSNGAAAPRGSPTALLNYLETLPGRVLSGQISDYWQDDSNTSVKQITAATGKTPAITEYVMDMIGSPENSTVVALSNQALASGQIVMVATASRNPFDGQYDGLHNGNIPDLYTPGNANYDRWQGYLQTWAAELKQIKGPVLWQPFGEMNGSWNWSGGLQPAQFIALWKNMRQVFDAAGVNNILWVYSPNSGQGNYTAYYPGDAQVDVLGMHSYPPGVNDTQMYDELVAIGKPLLYAEVGVSSPSRPNNFVGDNSALLNTVLQHFPKVVGVMIFCQSWALPNQNGMSAFMNNPAIINLKDLPPGI
jgi:beta-mannanase